MVEQRRENWLFIYFSYSRSCVPLDDIIVNKNVAIIIRWYRSNDLIFEVCITYDIPWVGLMHLPCIRRNRAVTELMCIFIIIKITTLSTTKLEDQHTSKCVMILMNTDHSHSNIQPSQSDRDYRNNQVPLVLVLMVNDTHSYFELAEIIPGSFEVHTHQDKQVT